MAKVKTFLIHEVSGLNDIWLAQFITECEQQHYVNVTTTYIPYPTPRLTVIVTKLDEKEPEVITEQHKTEHTHA